MDFMLYTSSCICMLYMCIALPVILSLWVNVETKQELLCLSWLSRKSFDVCWSWYCVLKGCKPQQNRLTKKNTWHSFQFMFDWQIQLFFGICCRSVFNKCSFSLIKDVSDYLFRLTQPPGATKTCSGVSIFRHPVQVRMYKFWECIYKNLIV